MSTDTAMRSERLPSRNSFAMEEASGMREVMVTAMPGLNSLRILVRAVAWVWLTAKMMDLPICRSDLAGLLAGRPRT